MTTPPATTAPAPAKGKCTHCFVAINGWEPDMGEDDFAFAPGTCTCCGTVEVIVWVPITW